MLDPLFGMYGLKIITDSTMSKRIQYRFPRSKKRRMRKKWSKDQKNWRTVPLDTIYQMGDMLIMHPAMMERIRKETKQKKTAESADSLIIHAKPAKESSYA